MNAVHTDDVQGLLHALHKKVDVVFDIVRLVRVTVANQVGHDGTKTVLRQKGVVELEVAVATGAAAAAVQKHHRLTTPLIQIVNGVAIGQLRVVTFG